MTLELESDQLSTLEPEMPYSAFQLEPCLSELAPLRVGCLFAHMFQWQVVRDRGKAEVPQVVDCVCVQFTGSVCW